jgi:polyferredoxin
MQPQRSRLTEDWLAVITGLFIFVLALTTYFGADVLGWVVTTSVWTNVTKALAPVSKAYAGLPS